MKFSATKEGRPFLVSPQLSKCSDYNVTHDGDWVAIAFHRRPQRPVRLGIDVMSRTLPKYEPSVRSFVETMEVSMTKDERAWVLRGHPDAEKIVDDRLLSLEDQKKPKEPLSAEDKEMLARQFDLWTHKEALTKNIGRGLGFDFAKVEVALWECDGEAREKRHSPKAILGVEGKRDDAYRFVEIMLPAGKKSVNGPDADESQLVVAEGPFEWTEEQISPALTAAEAERSGLLQIWDMHAFIEESRKQASK